MPTREDMDRISTEIPVCMLRTCAHIAACNTVMLERIRALKNVDSETISHVDFINGLLREIGSLVYAAHQGKDPQGDRVEELLSQIDGKHQSIAACKEQIAVLKKCRECPGCGTMCGRDDKFCKSCGRPL